MNRFETFARDSRRLAFLMILPLLLIMVIVNFQPFFTGDEFLPFGAQLESSGFLGGFAWMNDYKPRLIHHGILSALVSLSAPRWVWAALVYIVLATIAYLIIDIVDKLYQGLQRLSVLFLSAFAFFSCRYALVVYYEYANSLIDIVALLFFLLGARVFVIKKCTADVGSFLMVALMFFGAGLNHERYAIIGSAVLGIWALFCMARNGFMYGLPRAVIALIPVGFVVALTLLVSKSGLMMGTGGQSVSLSGHIFVNAAKYVSNIFLGTGFGPELFWGKSAGIGLVMSVFGTIAAMVMAFLGWLSKNGEKTKDCFAWSMIVGVFVAIGVMSLPALDRMEMRWVTVVFVMLIFIFVILSGKRALPVLSFLVIANIAFHTTAYRNNEILAVVAPKSAERFGNLLRVMDFDSTSLKVQANSDAGWLFLGSKPDQYMMANRKSVAINTRLKKIIHDDGSRYVEEDSSQPCIEMAGVDEHRLPFFFQVKQENEHNSNRAHSDSRVLGHGKAWDGWTFAAGVEKNEQGVVLQGVQYGFLRIEPKLLLGRNLVYHVQAGETSTVRWQINWHDRDGELLRVSSIIRTFSHTNTILSKKIVVPEGAETGYIYITGHGPLTHPVVFCKVEIQ